MHSIRSSLLSGLYITATGSFSGSLKLFLKKKVLLRCLLSFQCHLKPNSDIVRDLCFYVASDICILALFAFGCVTSFFTLEI
jgi:hypothetical protein